MEPNSNSFVNYQSTGNLCFDKLAKIIANIEKYVIYPWFLSAFSAVLVINIVIGIFIL